MTRFESWITLRICTVALFISFPLHVEMITDACWQHFSSQSMLFVKLTGMLRGTHQFQELTDIQMLWV